MNYTMKKKFNFANTETSKTHSVAINLNTKQGKKRKPYGGLFDK